MGEKVLGNHNLIAVMIAYQSRVVADAVVSSRRFPHLVEDLRREGGFVLRQEAPVVLGHHLGGVLDGITRLLIGAGLLENMGREHVPNIVRAVRQ